MYYVCVHDLDEYIRAVLEKACQAPDGNGIRIVKVYPGAEGDDTVTCQVEAPTKEAFLCWLNEVNAHWLGRWTEVAAPPRPTQAAKGRSPG